MTRQVASRRMRGLAAILLGILLLAPSLPAAVPAFTGVVRDAGGDPLPGAVVALRKAGVGTLTDATGAFVLGTPSDPDLLVATAEGYRPAFAYATASGGALALDLVPETRSRVVVTEGSAVVPASARAGPVPDAATDGRVARIPFEVAAGAVGGAVTLEWDDRFVAPVGTVAGVNLDELTRVRLRADVVHLESGQRLGLVTGHSPLAFPLPSHLLHDAPGAYALDVRVFDSGTPGVEVAARIAVEYGAWWAKNVLGKAPEIVDAAGDGAGRNSNPQMDLLAVRFTNETATDLEIEILLSYLDEPAAIALPNAWWGAFWNADGRPTFAALLVEQGRTRAVHGACTPEGCGIALEVPYRIEPGSPGRIVLRVPTGGLTALLGQPEGITTETARAYRVTTAELREGAADTTAPGADYALGLDSYALPASTVESLRAATLAGPASNDSPFLWLVAGIAFAAAVVGAWKVRHRVFPRATGALAPGATFAGRYKVQRLLGRGGGGRAFLAHDTLLARDVVLKCIEDEPSAHALREARLASTVAHPNVVTVHDVLLDEGRAVIVSEYLPGGPLEARLAAAGPLSLDEGLAVLDGVLAGLAAVHERDIVHRDVKPSNILFDAKGRPKVGDFGVSRSSSDTTRGAGVLGTPRFMAPEQLRGEPATAATDVHAVGLLLRRCVRAPLPAAVEAVAERALAPRPEDRFENAGEMRAALASASRAEDEHGAADAQDVPVAE